MMRSSALSLALGYVASGHRRPGAVCRARCGTPGRSPSSDGRSEILQADAQRLADVYRREGGEGLKSFIDARVHMQIAGDRILLLTDSSLSPLAGNLPAWPRNLPADARQLPDQIDTADHGVQATLGPRRAASAIYYLLVGRDNKMFAPLERRFWYGLTAAIAVFVDRRPAGRPDHAPRAHVACLQHPPDRLGDHSRRSEAPAADQSERRRARYARAHHQRHARADRTSWCTACATCPIPSRMICALRSPSCARGSRNSP